MTTYETYEPRSNFGLMVFLAFVGAAILGTTVYLFLWPDQGKAYLPDEGAVTTPDQSEVASSPIASDSEDAEPVVEGPEPSDLFDADPGPVPEPAETGLRSTPEQILIDSGMGVTELDPEILLGRIGESLQNSNLKEATLLIGRKALNEAHLSGLQTLVDRGDFRLHAQNPVLEIGELEANRRARWALNPEGGKGSRIYFDLARQPGGGWGVADIKLPDEETGRAVFSDALGVSRAFLEAALQQNFDDAKSFVDSAKVSDAKIAGLCIIFEEGKYQLRARKPVRAMLSRELTSAFIAHVEDVSGEKAADFGLNVQRASEEAPWRVTEINLDSLLADYARRVSGGDVHYTPLVKNPTGGDTLILYFGFDEHGLTPRTQRQLDIVAGLLQIDPDKKLTLSGHTDSLGTDQYNHGLSARRAGAVQRYLLQVGVPESQIIAMAEGEAKPRLPNSTEDGEDNPTGRRANRRTEIYLDF